MHQSALVPFRVRRANFALLNRTFRTLDFWAWKIAWDTSFSGNICEMSGVGSTLPERNSAMALAKGPQREPTTVISLTTIGQVFTGAAPWNVDFRSSVPRGSVMCSASVKPVGD